MLRRCRVLLWVVCIGVLSCTAGKDAEEFAEHPKQSSNVVSIAHLKSLYHGEPLLVNRNMEIRAMVSANDRYGNFNNEIVIEDSSGAMTVKIAGDGVFNTYVFGDSVKINCFDLTLGAYGGAVQLGSAPSGEYQCGYLTLEEAVDKIVVYSASALSPQFRRVAICDIDERMIDCRVEVCDVEFAEQNVCWCDNGAAATARTLVDRQGNRLNVRTLSDALFASVMLPAGSGSICGILSYFGGEYQLRVINHDWSSMTAPRF